MMMVMINLRFFKYLSLLQISWHSKKLIYYKNVFGKKLSHSKYLSGLIACLAFLFKKLNYDLDKNFSSLTFGQFVI